MSLMKKLAITVGLALTWKQAMAQAAATAVVAGVTAGTLGADPLPWIVGSGGAAVAFLLRRPTTWNHALAHALISVFCGGVGAPWVATVISHYVHPVLANDLVLAAVLSIGWPVLVPIVMDKVLKHFGASPAQPTGNGGQ